MSTITFWAPAPFAALPICFLSFGNLLEFLLYCYPSSLLSLLYEFIPPNSPLVTDERKCHPYKMDLAFEMQEVLHIGSTHNKSAMPFLHHLLLALPQGDHKPVQQPVWPLLI